MDPPGPETLASSLPREEVLLRAAWFDALFESAPIPALICLADGLIDRANAAFEALLGYAPGEVPGRSVLEFIAPDDHAAARQMAGPLTHGAARVHQVELRFLRRDGGRVPVLATSSEFFVRGMRYGITQLTDLTAERRADAERQEMHDRLRTAMAGAGAGAWEMDASTGTVRADEVMHRQFGAKLQDAPAPLEDWLRRVHPDDAAALGAMIGRLRQGLEEIMDVDFRIRLPDGSVRWSHAYGRLTRDGDGRPARLGGITLDTTQHHQAEMLAQEAEKRMRLALRAAGAGTWDADPQAGTLIWDDEVRRQYGLRDDEPTPDLRGWLRRIHADDRDRVRVAVERAMADPGATFDVEFRIPLPDGSVRQSHAFGRAERDAGGRAVWGGGISVDVTEHRRAAAEAREHQRRFRALVENFPGMAYRCRNDRDWTLELVSQGALALTGYPAADFLGRKVLLADVIVPEDREAVWGAVQAALAENRTFELRYRMRDAQGAVKWVWEKGQAVPAAAGHTMIEGFIVDITAQVHAEASQQRLAAIVESSDDAIFSLSPAGLITTWNAAAEATYGYPAAEAIGMHVSQLAAPERLDDVRARIADVRAGKPMRIESVDRRRDGTRFDVAITMSALKDAHGTVTGYAAINRDITARKTVERELREAQERFNEIAETVSEVFWVYDSASGRVLYASPAYEKIWGRSRQSLYADFGTMLAAIHEDDRARVAHAIEEEARGVAFEQEYRVVAPDGAVRWVWDRSFAVRDADGVVRHHVGAAADITERKRQSERLANVNQALRALSRSNRALIHAVSERQLYDEMIQAVVETAGYPMACIGLKDPAAPAGLSCAHGASAHCAGHPRFCDGMEGRMGPCFACLKGAQVQVVHDLGGQAATDAWAAKAHAAGFGSALFLPLNDGTGVFGTLGIFASEPDSFDEDETRLLAEMADDLSFGVVTLRMRAERDRGAERLQRSMEETVRVLGSTVEMRDPYTAGHQRKVAEVSVAIGRLLGLEEECLRGLELGATIHDIGKISTPAEILAKPGRLTPAEFELIKAHPGAGAEILEGIDFSWPIREMVWQHHERMDGSGYPRGLKGDAILLEARIIAVADVLEAVASHRPYRPAMGVQAALAILERERGTHFDAQVVDACLKLFREGPVPAGFA